MSVRTTIDIADEIYSTLRQHATQNSVPGEETPCPDGGPHLWQKVSVDHCARTRRRPTTSYLADINVWLALSYSAHSHSGPAWQWFRALKEDQVCFCRLSQLGLLRLLTAAAVTGDSCLTLQAAWEIYVHWLRDPHVGFLHEPIGVEIHFRAVTARVGHTSAPKALADSCAVTQNATCLQ